MNLKKIFLPLTLIATTVFSSGTLTNNNDVISNDNTVDITFNLEGDAVFSDTGLHTKTINVKKSLSWKYVSPKAPTNNDILYEGYTLDVWQYEDTSSTPSTRKDITDTYHFDTNTNLYARFKDANITLTFALPALEDQFILPATSARLPNGTLWKDVKAKYEPREKEGVTITKFFKQFKNEDNKVLGVDVGTIDHPIEELATDKRAFTAEFVNLETSSFATDPWDVFIKACNKGLTYMKETSRGAGLGYKEDLVNGTFVGLTRTISIAGKDYTVRVIGEGVDKSYEGEKTTTLTFEFVDVISEARSYASNFSLNNAWGTSALRQSLYYGGDLFSILPNEIQKAIVPVKKLTYIGDDEPATSIVNTKEYLFPLSLSEIGFTGKIGDAQQTVLAEGSAYKYYETIVAGIRNKLLGTNNISYYVRSPQLDISVCAWYINSNDTTGFGIPTNAMDVSYGLGVAPAFCIGVAE